MTTLLGLCLVATALVLVALVLRDHRLGKCELFSVRNVGIAGFIVFQLSSGAYSLISGDFGRFGVSDPASVGLQFVLMVLVFSVVAWWTYRRGWGVVRLARSLPTTWATPTATGLVFMAVVVTLLGAGLRFGFRIPVLGVLTSTVGIGLSAVACGLVGWVWGRRLMNPMVACLSILIIVGNGAVVMTGAFGRRGLVTVAGAVLWGMYYSNWRHLGTTTLLARIVVLSAPAVIFVALYTSVRSAAEHDRTARQHLQEITRRGDLGRGMRSLMSGQYGGAISMFLIENYPENYEYRHLMTVRYFAVYAVPRIWWSDKPVPLSHFIARQAHLTRVNVGRLKIGPGIIGAAAAEGGWYALIIYAILGALYYRFFDEIIYANPGSPFVIVAVGSALGQFLAVPRGSITSFAFTGMLTVLGALAFMVFFGKLTERVSPGAMYPGDYDLEGVESYGVEAIEETKAPP